MSQHERNEMNGPTGIQFDSSGDHYMLKNEIAIKVSSKGGSHVQTIQHILESSKSKEKTKELMVDEHSYH